LQEGGGEHIARPVDHCIVAEPGKAAPGARPLRRAVENYIEDPLAEELLKPSLNGTA